MQHRNGKKSERASPPPYRAWPEIAHPLRLYMFPTLYSVSAITSALYWPSNSNWISYATIEEQEWAKDLFNQNLPPGVERHSREYDQYHSQVLVKEKREAGISQSQAEWEVFCYYHELGHVLSLTSDLRVITKGKALAAAIFDLLRPAGVAQCRNFWAEFEMRNKAFLDHLEKVLALEELRATFYAFIFIHPDIRTSVAPELRKVMVKEVSIRLFDKVAEITNRNWAAAWCLTIYAEFACGEEDPAKWLDVKCSEPVLRVDKNLESRAMLELFLSDDRPGWSVDLGGSTVFEVDINFIPPDDQGKISRVYHKNSEEVKEAILLESLRQQLAQSFGLSLVCPFQHRDFPCCGYGHYLRAIWDQTSPVYRDAKSVIYPKTGKKLFVRAPHKACLNYGLG
jgi:hypothetical protein